MIIVSDKKIVKHTLSTGDALVEIPLRITFEYALEDQRFMPGTMQRKVLYNLQPVLRRFSTVSKDTLEADIESTVDQALIEHLCYAGQAARDVSLYAAPDLPTAAITCAGTDNTEDDPPKIILPR